MFNFYKQLMQLVNLSQDREIRSPGRQVIYFQKDGWKKCCAWDCIRLQKLVKQDRKYLSVRRGPDKCKGQDTTNWLQRTSSDKADCCVMGPVSQPKSCTWTHRHNKVYSQCPTAWQELTLHTMPLCSSSLYSNLKNVYKKTQEYLPLLCDAVFLAPLLLT